MARWLTVALEALLGQAVKHGAAVVAKCGSRIAVLHPLVHGVLQLEQSVMLESGQTMAQRRVPE